MTQRMTVEGTDDIAKLATTFNEMLERLQAAFESQQEFIKDAGHELRTPITVIRGYLETLHYQPERQEQKIALAIDELDRMNLRNPQPRTQANTTLQVGNVTLDLLTHQVRVDDRLVELSAREFLLTEFFLRHPMQVLTREQILDRIWGYDYAPGTNVVNVYVGCLRKKLGEGWIETVRGIGYRLRP